MNKLLKWASILLIVGQGVVITLIIVQKSTITTHWNIAGEADASGSKYVSIILIAFSIAIFLSFCFLDKHPEWYNYPKKFINREQANVYLSRFAWVISTGTLTLFTYLNLMMYLGGNLNLWILATIFLLTIAAIVKCVKKLNIID